MGVCWFSGREVYRDTLVGGLSIGQMFWESILRGIGWEPDGRKDQADFDSPLVQISCQTLRTNLTSDDLSKSLIPDVGYVERINQAMNDFCDNDIFDPDPTARYWVESHALPRCWFSRVACEPAELIWGKTLYELFHAGVKFDGEIRFNSDVANFFSRRYRRNQAQIVTSEEGADEVFALLFGCGIQQISELGIGLVRPCIWREEAIRLLRSHERGEVPKV
jgi:hypothetical protein